MPGKVSKRGFKKLPNSEEVAVLVEDGSGSEIELLDMTDLKTHRNGGLNLVRDAPGSSCCTWFVPLYMVLLTFLLVLLTTFQLYVAYNVQLLRTDISDITTQVNSLKDNLSSLQLTTQQMNETHSKELAAVRHSLQKQLDGINNEISKFQEKISHLETIQKQQIVDQVKKFNKSLSVIYSFAQEVDEIHQNIAELGSTVSSLDDQVKKVKQSVGDAEMTSEKMSGVVQNVQDTLTVLQGQVTTHEEKISSELAEIHYELGNMTQDMDSMDGMDQAFLTTFIKTIIANSSNLSMNFPSEAWRTDLSNLERKIDELLTEADSLTMNLTSLQERVSSLEAKLLPLAEHIHNFYPPSKNSTTPTGSTGTESDSSLSDEDNQGKMNSPGSLEGDDFPTNTAMIPTPTISSSSSFAHGRPSYGRFTFASSSSNGPASSGNATMPATIHENQMEMSTSSSPSPTSLPTASEDGASVAHPNDTDFEQSADSKELAIKFVHDLLHDFVDLDHNEDRFLSPHEFSQFFSDDNGDVFKSLDLDRSGELTEEELHNVLDRLQHGEENGGVDKSWQDDQQKSDKKDFYNYEDPDDSPTSKDDAFNWQDYV